MSGLFITMEGIDGSGKTTQINLLNDYFKQKGFDVVLVREPGGTIISEKIREIILDIKNKDMTYVTEALLYAASRAQLVAQVIVPAIKKGAIVLCDRFVDSSIVYQGVARDLGVDVIKNINNVATGGLQPDITFFLDLQYKEAIKRKKEQKKLDRLESEKELFYKNVYNGYKMLLDENDNRIKNIDATLPIEDIYEKIKNEIEKFLI